MEKRVYSGQLTLDQLNVGDSLADMISEDWRRVAEIPEDVAETWLTHHKGSYTSLKSTVSSGPLKEWKAGFGVIVTINPELTTEKLVMLRKTRNGFVLYESKKSRQLT